MSTATVRLFVALDLPEAPRRALAAFGATAAAADPALRAVRPEALHVTLCFLGARPEADVEMVGAVVRKSTRGALGLLALGAPRWLAPRRPGVLAIELEDGTGALALLQTRLAGALAAGGWYAPERRAFLPHVTVARVRRGARPRPVLPPAPRTEGFAGTAVTLYASRLGPGGARYAALTRVRA